MRQKLRFQFEVNKEEQKGKFETLRALISECKTESDSRAEPSRRTGGGSDGDPLFSMSSSCEDKLSSHEGRRSLPSCLVTYCVYLHM